MAGTDRSAGDRTGAADPLDGLAASARGWHRTQLAVLGFIGFCGILWDGDSVTGAGVQWVLVALVTLAFALAVAAILLVGRVAHPVHGPAEAAGDDHPRAVAAATRRLTTGIRLTSGALALVVAATLAAWLPRAGDGGAVVVADATGQTWCGDLAEAPAGQARLVTSAGPVTLPLDSVVVLRPVGGC